VNGGGSGRTGRNVLIRNGAEEILPGKIQLDLKAGDRLRLETPGGGGFGPPSPPNATSGSR
jgi:N-methylhydantoinase B/oxoprolinase/acetone carboxylase alpha subunit